MEVTLQQIIDAAEKNGYAWSGNNSPGGYCILDQVALNLDFRYGWVPVSDGLNALARRENNMQEGIGDVIWMYNDDNALSYEDALRFLKEKVKDFDPTTIITIKTPNL